jgi:hypothetical protein
MRNAKLDFCSQIDYTIVEMKKQQELLLNRGRLIYTKLGLFGVNYSKSFPFPFQFDEEVSKFTSETNPTGDQVNSTQYIIEHPVVLSGQRSPSSSEDG